MSNALAIVRDHLARFFHQIRWSGLYGFDVSEDQDLERMIDAYMNLDTWCIHVSINTSITGMFARLLVDEALLGKCEPARLLPGDSPDLAALQLDHPLQPGVHALLYDFLAAIAFHEFGHSKECPVNIDAFSSIVQAVNTALEQQEKENGRARDYIVNLFTDVIINTIHGIQPSNAFFRNGLFLFQAAELLRASTSDALFSLFVLLNCKLYQFHRPARDCLEDLVVESLNQEYQGALEKMVAIFSPSEQLARCFITGASLTEEEQWRVIGHLSEQDKWPAMAHELATILADFLPDDGTPPTQKVPDSFFVKKFNESESFKSEVLERIIERKLGLEGEDGEPGGHESGREDTNPPRNNVPASLDGDPGESYPGENDAGSGMSGFDENVVLDTMYRHRVMKMDVSMPVVEDKAVFPLGYMNRQVMNEHDDPAAMDPLGVYFLPGSGDLLIYKREVPLTIEHTGHVSGKGFPDLMLVCDDSGSMSWDPWGGDGKYDAVLVLVYSLLQWLKEQGFAAAIEYNLVTFSTTTRTTGWVDYFHLDDMQRLLFNKEGGGTNLNPEQLQAALDSPREKVVVMITDGEIQNSKGVHEVLRSNRDAMHFLFVQIGSMSRFGNELKRDGFPVLQVHDVSILDAVVMAFVKDVYDGTR